MNEKSLPTESKENEKKEISLLDLLVDILKEKKTEKKSRLVEAMD